MFGHSTGGGSAFAGSASGTRHGAPAHGHKHSPTSRHGNGHGHGHAQGRGGRLVEDDHFPVPRKRERSAIFARSWSHHNLLLKSQRWNLPFQFNRIHFFDYEREQAGIDDHLEAGGMKSTRSKGLVLNVISALRGAFNEAEERRKSYHESVNRWQRFLQHSMKAPPPRTRFGQAPVEVVFVRHCEGNHNAMGSLGTTTYPDASLTNLGVEQGLTTGAVMEDLHFDYIVTSPLSRCLETCILLCQHEGIHAAPQCPVIVCPEAREFRYHARWLGNQGTPASELQQRFWKYQTLFDLSAVESCDDLLRAAEEADMKEASAATNSPSSDSDRKKSAVTIQRHRGRKNAHHRVIPRVRPLPEDWCPIEAEWQFQYRCDRFRRWLGRRFRPGSKVLVISHGMLFRSGWSCAPSMYSPRAPPLDRLRRIYTVGALLFNFVLSSPTAFPGEGKIHNGEFRHFYIDRDGGFFSVKGLYRLAAYICGWVRSPNMHVCFAV